ncbi:MAG: 30S ribosomal protein S4 [archaeon]
MGDIRRKHNLYSRPKKMFEASRIENDNKVQKEYGLKSKTEVWKAAAKVAGFRKRAKKLISTKGKESEEFFQRLQNMGLEVKVTSDVLALTAEAVLNRRLQTMVFKKGLARTILEARQLITHKNVIVDERIVNIPSFSVSKNLENKISLKERKN